MQNATSQRAVSAVEIGLAAKLFAGFSDRTRLAILVELSAGERRVTDLVKALAGSQGNISGHLSCLKECGLVRDRPEGRQVFYRIALAEVLEVLRGGEALLAITRRAVQLCARTMRHNRERAKSICAMIMIVMVVRPSMCGRAERSAGRLLWSAACHRRRVTPERAAPFLPSLRRRAWRQLSTSAGPDPAGPDPTVTCRPAGSVAVPPPGRYTPSTRLHIRGRPEWHKRAGGVFLTVPLIRGVRGLRRGLRGFGCVVVG